MLQDKTLYGVFWSFFEQLLSRGISIIVTLLLARFLVPEDFGLLAMMTVFIAIATALMNSGIKQAIIRKPNPDDAYLSTAFYTNLVLGVIAYSLLFAASPSIATFYEEPRLTLLIRVTGVVVLINAFQVIQIAILSRDLNFKMQMKASVPAALISGVVAVILAYTGFGVWALIAQTLLSALLIVLIYWWVQPWRPKAVFDMASLKEMYNFGYKLFIASFFSAISNNIYVLVIAKLFSTSIAGLYFFADKLKELVVKQMVSSIQRVTYPALSTLQNNNQKLKSGYRQVLKVTAFVLSPALFLLAALATPLFDLLFPESWQPAALYFQIMCIVSVLYPMHAVNLNILKIKGRTDLYLFSNIFKKITLFLILFISYRYGIVGILIGQGIQSLVAYLPNSCFSSKLIGYNHKEQISDILPSLSVAAMVSLVVFWLQPLFSMHPLISLFVFGSMGVALYLLLAKLLKLSAYQLAERMIRKRLPSRVKAA